MKMNTENKIPLLNRDLPFPINYEDFYITQNDLMYEQIRSNGKYGSLMKVMIRRNYYDYQSCGNLYVMRTNGWIPYHSFRIDLLRAFKWSQHSRDVLNRKEALDDFRADSQEICDLFNYHYQGETK